MKPIMARGSGRALQWLFQGDAWRVFERICRSLSSSRLLVKICSYRAKAGTGHSLSKERGCAINNQEVCMCFSQFLKYSRYHLYNKTINKQFWSISKSKLCWLIITKILHSWRLISVRILFISNLERNNIDE